MTVQLPHGRHDMTALFNAFSTPWIRRMAEMAEERYGPFTVYGYKSAPHHRRGHAEVELVRRTMAPIFDRDWYAKTHDDNGHLTIRGQRRMLNDRATWRFRPRPESELNQTEIAIQRARIEGEDFEVCVKHILPINPTPAETAEYDRLDVEVGYVEAQAYWNSLTVNPNWDLCYQNEIVYNQDLIDYYIRSDQTDMARHVAEEIGQRNRIIEDLDTATRGQRHDVYRHNLGLLEPIGTPVHDQTYILL